MFSQVDDWDVVQVSLAKEDVGIGWEVSLVEGGEVGLKFGFQENVHQFFQFPQIVIKQHCARFGMENGRVLFLSRKEL